MSKNGMIPGQEPYTQEELQRLHKALEEACEATEYFTEDELEEAADECRLPRRG